MVKERETEGIKRMRKENEKNVSKCKRRKKKAKKKIYL